MLSLSIWFLKKGKVIQGRNVKIRGKGRGKGKAKKSERGKAKRKDKGENYLADSGCDMQASESTL